MIEHIEGIVLNEKSYGETSKIINVLTKKYGVVGMLAKGAKGIKSELRSVTSPLIYGNFTVYYKPDKLSLLNSVDVIDPFKNIKKDIVKISYASFLLELSLQVVKQNPDSMIYQILVDGLKKINEGFDPLVIMNIIELKYLYYLGVMPILDCCSICGNKSAIATLSSRRGGYVCVNCLTNEKSVNKKTIQLIRMFFYVDIGKIEKLSIQEEPKKEINQFLDEYYEQYTGLYLNSKNFLKNINKVTLR